MKECVRSEEDCVKTVSCEHDVGWCWMLESQTDLFPDRIGILDIDTNYSNCMSAVENAFSCSIFSLRAAPTYFQFRLSVEKQFVVLQYKLTCWYLWHRCSHSYSNYWERSFYCQPSDYQQKWWRNLSNSTKILHRSGLRSPRAYLWLEIPCGCLDQTKLRIWRRSRSWNCNFPTSKFVSFISNHLDHWKFCWNYSSTDSGAIYRTIGCIFSRVQNFSFELVSRINHLIYRCYRIYSFTPTIRCTQKPGGEIWQRFKYSINSPS